MGPALLCDGRKSQATKTESVISAFVMNELKIFYMKLLLSDVAHRLDVKINVGHYLIRHYMALFLNILSAKGLFIAQRPAETRGGSDSGLQPEALICLRKIIAR